MTYLVLLLSVVAGVATVLGFKLTDPRKVKLLTAFTGAYLIGLTFLHMVPEVFAPHDHEKPDAHTHSAHAHNTEEGHGHTHHGHTHADDHHHTPPTGLILGAFVLAGFFLQIILEHFSHGLEHGHSHAHHGAVPLGMMAGLSIHAFLEAVPSGQDSMLLMAIAVHKYPVTIVLFGMLLQSSLSRRTTWLLLCLFAAMAPLGALAGDHTVLAHYHRQLIAVVIGIFMHIATTILFEAGESHQFNRNKAIAIVLGTIAAFGSVLLHQH
ncbi:MAG: ZIP family metal transporter [Verrucomicrobiota bacterium]|nr:ZIP family metal transporter [Verrucomicrobiota bacterium]